MRKPWLNLPVSLAWSKIETGLTSLLLVNCFLFFKFLFTYKLQIFNKKVKTIILYTIIHINKL